MTMTSARHSGAPVSRSTRNTPAHATAAAGTSASAPVAVAAAAGGGGGRLADVDPSKSSASIPDLLSNLTHFTSTFAAHVSRASSALSSDLAEARAQVESLDADLAEAHTALATVRDERTQLASDLASVQSQLAQNQAELAQATADRDAARADLDQAHAQHAQLQSAHDTLAELVGNATDELAAKEAQVDELQAAVEQAADQLAQYELAEAQWERTRAEYLDQVHALEGTVADRTAEVDVLRDEGERIKELVAERDVQIQEYESTLVALEEEGKEMATKVVGLEKDNAQLKATLTSTETQLETARVSLTNLESRCSTMESQLSEKDQYIRNANHEIETLAQARDDMEGELIRVTETLNDLEIERSRLQARMSEVQKEAAGHAETVEVLSNQLDEERSAKDRAQQELRMALDKVKQVQDELDAVHRARATGPTGASSSEPPLVAAAKDKEIAELRAELEALKRKNTPFLVPKTKGPSSVMSTSSQLYSTMERLGIKRKAGAMTGSTSAAAAAAGVAKSTVGGARDSALGTSAGFRTPDLAAAGSGSLPNKRPRLDPPVTTSASTARGTSRRSPLGRGNSGQLGPNDSASVVGRSEYTGSVVGGGSGAAHRLSRPSSNGLRKSTVVTFSGFRESLAEYQPQLKEQLVKVIEEIGGGVLLGNDEFDPAITHVVTPVNSRTFKTLAAALCHRWLVFDVNWVHDSAKAGKFIEANKYGVRYFAAPFKGKSVCVTAAFREENHLRPFRIENAIRLVETYGKGTITADPDKCDMILTTTTDKREYQAKRLDWTSFIKLIMPDETYTPKS